MVSSFVFVLVFVFVFVFDGFFLCDRSDGTGEQLAGIWRLRHERMWGRSDYCSHFMIVIIIISIVTTMLLFNRHRGYFQHRHHHKC